MRRLFLPAIAFAFALVPALAADTKPVEPFNGKDLKGWKTRDEKKNRWVVGVPHVADDSDKITVIGVPKPVYQALINFTNSGGTDIYTEAKYTDVLVEVEFMIPKGSNSGVYLMGEYEVQVFDSYGKPDDQAQAWATWAAIYSAAAPKVNACEEAGRVAEVRHRVPGSAVRGRQEDQRTASSSRSRSTTSVIHENVEVTKSTGGGLTGKERREADR